MSHPIPTTPDPSSPARGDLGLALAWLLHASEGLRLARPGLPAPAGLKQVCVACRHFDKG